MIATSTNGTEAAVGSVRVQQIVQQQLHELYSRTDRLFAGLMVFQWACAIAAALWISPNTWIGTTRHIHIHVWAAVILGGLICSLPVIAAKYRPGYWLTRHIIAIAQMLMSALLIHVTGGRIETHFHVFGSLAFLAFYRDWKVLVSATVVVTLDHFLRGVYWPQSVFGELTASPWRWMEHAGWVVFENVFLIWSCLKGTEEIQSIADKQAALESTNELVEAQVRVRTAELNASQRNFRRSEQSIRAILDTAADAIITIDVEGLIQSANPAAEKIFGYSAGELIGHNVKLLMPLKFMKSMIAVCDTIRIPVWPRLLAGGSKSKVYVETKALSRSICQSASRSRTPNSDLPESFATSRSARNRNGCRTNKLD